MWINGVVFVMLKCDQQLECVFVVAGEIYSLFKDEKDAVAT